MLKLAVCDNNSLFLEEIESLLYKDERVEKVYIYSDPNQMLFDIKAGNEVDAVFMDIDLQQEETGMDYARKVYEMVPEVKLLYVTGYQDIYAQQIFLSKANLTGFLIKPVDQKILTQYLDRLAKEKKPKKLLHFSVRGKEHILMTDGIIFLESDNHRTLIHTEDQIYSVYDKLSNFAQKLPKSFIQCHKSFLVNMDQIRYIQGNEISLLNGDKLPVSRVHQEKVRKEYFAYIGKTL